MRKKLIVYLFIQATLLYVLAIRSEVVAQPSVVNSANYFQESDCSQWEEVSLSGENWSQNWEVAYDGFGQIHFDKGVTLQPRKVASISLDETHSALTLTKQKFKDFGVRIHYANMQSLREPQSNSWEVFWLLFNYNPDIDEKKTNYFIFKPNGIELGQAWGLVDQKFLATKDYPRAEMKKQYELTLIKKNQSLKVFIDGQSALHFQGAENLQLLDDSGQIGLYAEDSLVHISKFEICKNLSN